MQNRPLIYAPPGDPLDIIYQDDDLILVNKPAGLLSVPGKADDHKDSLETRVKTAIPKALLVHRLDMATSGLMVFAANPNAQRHLGLQFEKRYIQKQYIARVDGLMRGESGHINLPLLTDWPNRPRQKVDFETGKSAQTDWEVLEREPRSTRIALYPKTGRSHQLRVHMLAIGHVILGDQLYAEDKAFKAATRLQLHAKRLTLRHPAGGEWMTFEAPCPF